MGFHAQGFGLHTILQEPIPALLTPVFEVFAFGARRHKILHFHLFEFPCAEEEILRINFISERLTNLRDTEGRLLAGGFHHIFEIHEYPLRGFRAEIDHIAHVLDRTDKGLEHEVKIPHLGPFFRTGDGVGNFFINNNLVIILGSGSGIW